MMTADEARSFIRRYPEAYTRALAGVHLDLIDEKGTDLPKLRALCRVMQAFPDDQIASTPRFPGERLAYLRVCIRAAILKGGYDRLMWEFTACVPVDHPATLLLNRFHNVRAVKEFNSKGTKT